METKTKARFTKDEINKKITVVKQLDAPVNEVWKAYTDRSKLDQWWAPKPYRAETKELNFREGGRWWYAMVGPTGDRQWATLNFKTIDAPKRFTAVDAFTDEKGNRDPKMPSIQWTNSFEKHGDGTKLTAELKFESAADMKKILDTGFEQGFQMGLDNLEDLLSK